MNVRDRKLAKEAVQSLRRIPIGICATYDVLMAPVYVFLPKNGKFVAVKFPLQYFSTEEIEKFKPYENFYLPDFVDRIVPFQRAGESVRGLLRIRQNRPVSTNQGQEMVSLPLPQHELDDAALRLIGPLWGGKAAIEPFFICFFANEVCNPFSPKALTDAMEASTDLFELALLRASTAVFLALHIGYSDSRTLTAVREKIFWDTMNGSQDFNGRSEISLLEQLVWEALPQVEAKELSLQRFQEILQSSGAGGKVARKLLSRLSRVQKQFVEALEIPASLYGERGILD